MHKKSLIFISKILKFFKNYFLKDPVFVVKYIFAYLQKDYKPSAKFYTDEEFISGLKTGKSFIRIGDGEIGLIHHRDVSYQKAEKLLICKLVEIIENYNQGSNYILSIPIFVNMTNVELSETKGKLSCWLPLKIEFFRRFNSKVKYFDAHTFYKKNFFEKNIYDYLKDKSLIINTAEKNIISQKDNIENKFKVIEWIEAKSPNPFDLYIETTEKIENILKKEIDSGKNLEDIVLILGSGPMSKVLAYDFSKKDVQCIDIGKGFEQLYNDKNYEDEI